MQKEFNDNFKYEHIKAIIFDFDKTLYFSKDLDDYYTKFIKDTIVKLGGYNEEEALKIMEEYGFIGDKKRPSFAKTCCNFGISKESWDAYRIENFFEFDYENADVVSNATLQRLAQKYPLFLVSNEVKKNLITKANKLNIELSHFSNIFAPDATEIDTYPTKKEIYKLIGDNLNLTYNSLFAIGDRLLVDVQPLLELGGSGIIITHPDQINEICDEIIKKSTNDKEVLY
ncbi:MAG: HAD family hydrolase [Spirochaetales bacterium]